MVSLALAAHPAYGADYAAHQTSEETSNQTIHTASIYKDTDNITVAIIIYSLGKILEREKLKNIKGCIEFCKNAGLLIDNALNALKKDDLGGFKTNLEQIIKSINRLSPTLKKNIQDVFQKAKINKASKMYEHGISMEQTAKLLGITQFELAGYAGQKEVSETPETKTVDVKTRIKLAMDMFN